jgi:hypothetical protein
MKGIKIGKIVLPALAICSLIGLGGCAKDKRNANSFRLYFYTTNGSMPPLYIIRNNKLIGKLSVLSKDPTTLDTSLVNITSYDASTEIDGIQANGQIIETFQYTLNNDGTFKEGGGGYLLFDTWQKEKYVLLVRVNGQF